MVHGAALRLDKWLWFARLAKSRSTAKDLCESRRLRIDGRVVERASVLVRPGQVLSFPYEQGVVVVRVEGLPECRGSYVEACRHYTELASGWADAGAANFPSHQPPVHQPLTATAAAF